MYAKGENYSLSVRRKGHHSGPRLLFSAIPSIQEVLTMVGSAGDTGKVLCAGKGKRVQCCGAQGQRP